MDSAVRRSTPSLFVPLPAQRAHSGNPILHRAGTSNASDDWTLSELPDSEAVGLFGPSQQFTAYLERLRHELQSMRIRPKRVTYPSHTQPWNAVTQIDARALELADLLAEFDVRCDFTCRESLSEDMVAQLALRRRHIRVVVPVISADPTIQKALEPHSAPLDERLLTAARLADKEVPVQIVVAPILPNLTDTRESFELLMSKVAKYGFTNISAGYLFLRPGQKHMYQSVLSPHGWAEEVLAEFGQPKVLQDAGGVSATYLSKARRQRGYALLITIAAEFGIDVKLSRTANPDFDRSVPTGAAESARFQAFMRGVLHRRHKSSLEPAAN
jgi:DNA repair photolyase